MISQSVEAELLTDGRVKLVLPLSNLLLINLALWTTGTALEWDEKRFREPTGFSPTKVQSLNDEMIAVRYALEGSTPWLNPRTGEMVPPPEPRKIGSAWDELLKLEAKHLPDRRVAVILPHAKLAVFPELLEASLVYVAPCRSEVEKQKFRGRFASSTKEVEALRGELRRLGRKLRAESAPWSDL